MRTGLIAKKLGMTRLFTDNGDHVPVTVLKVAESMVVEQKTTDKHGYNAIVVGTEPVSPARLNKPQIQFFQKKNLPAFSVMKEFRVDESNMLDIGTSLAVTHFDMGGLVDVTAITIGKGFAGVMKRHNFGGLRASHGVSISHRSHGSTGQRQDPGKVFKGKKMAGHMGAVTVTQQNLRVVAVDVNKGLLLVNGSVPGANNSTVYVKDAIKNRKS